MILERIIWIMEPWRTIIEVLLTAMIGLNVLIIKGLFTRVGNVEESFQDHIFTQNEDLSNINDKLKSVRDNYIDRFAEVNANVSAVKEELLKELSEIKVAIAKLQTFNETIKKN